MGAERSAGGRLAGWGLIAIGALLTVLAFVDKRPSGDQFVKSAPELVARPAPVAKGFGFVKAPYPFDHTPWPYERLPGGQLQLRVQAP